MPTPQTSPVKAAAGGLAAGLGIAVSLIAPFEGERSHAYLDVGHVASICYGETEGVTMGQVRTHAQCVRMLDSDLQKRLPVMQACTHVPVSPRTSGALISFGYNVGTGAYCKSVAPFLNVGEPLTACAKISLYHYVHGVSIPGLVRRRQAERKLCEEGLS